MTELAWIDAAISAARPRALAALLRYFRNLDIAEEAVQDACLRALHTWPKTAPPRDPEAWLIMVGRNAAIDATRRQRKQEPLPAEEVISDLEDAEEVKIDTPFGAPSDPITVGEVAGRRVAFLPRHGRDHRFPPHKIPYRANMWALRSIGVRRVLAPTAVGSLTPSYGPGTLAFPDQLVDRTRTRLQTYYDEGACHVPFADPYCPSVRQAAIATARKQGWEPVSSGTLVVIEGPRFSTRAE